VIPASVDYVRAASFEEAFAALAAPEAKILAGGQSLLPAMKLRIARPSRVVDIGAFELHGVEERDGSLLVGALARWHVLEQLPVLQRPAYCAISECAAGIGDLQVRNRGTIGGSLAHADPASDMPAVVLALDGMLTLRSRDGERELPAAEFFLGPFTTALAQGELITEIRIPRPAEGSGSAYVAVEHPASGFALAGAAALVRADGTSRIALTGVGATPFLLEGDIDDDLAGAEIYGDRFAPEDYRRGLARTVVRRAVERAETRAGEDATWTA